MLNKYICVSHFWNGSALECLGLFQYAVILTDCISQLQLLSPALLVNDAFCELHWGNLVLMLHRFMHLKTSFIWDVLKSIDMLNELPFQWTWAWWKKRQIVIFLGSFTDTDTTHRHTYTYRALFPFSSKDFGRWKRLCLARSFPTLKKPPLLSLMKASHNSGVVMTGLCTTLSLPLLDRAFVFTAGWASPTTEQGRGEKTSAPPQR